MVGTTLPLTGIVHGQQMSFCGIQQLTQFPVYVSPNYKEVLSQAYEVHPYQTMVAVYDRDIPNVARFVDDISKLVDGKFVKMPLKAGEQLKTTEQIAHFAQRLGNENIGEKSVMLVIGGGTLCNFAGFLATMWSGMEPIFVPTNYTAVADVAIGSLHMINVGADKNRLQLYHDPLAVVFDPTFFTTLPKTERRNGLVETVKHAIAQEYSLFEKLEDHMTAGTLFEDNIVFDFALWTAQLKDELLSAAPFSEHTQHILLYGHVIAHAIESASNYEIPHGEAVSLGLLAELAFFHKPTDAIFKRVKTLLDNLGLPTKLPNKVEIEKVLDHLRHTMADDGTIAIPRVKELGGLQNIDGKHSADFNDMEILDALAAIK